MEFISGLWENRKILWRLGKNDCRARFSSSGLGIIWAFLQPLLNIIILWFVFQVGFKSMPVENVPFIIWYIPAFLSWNYFSEAVSQGTNSLVEYSYLLKKVNFKSELIPIIKVISAGIVHSVFIIFIIVINIIYGRWPNIYYIQILYYFFCSLCLCAALSWLLSSITVFVKDVSNLVGVVLQVGFWATPLFWDPSQMSPTVQFVLKLNPMYYVCMGYRESVLGQYWFFAHYRETIYFWCIVIIIFNIGTKLFCRLRPHFDDVL